MSVHANRKEEKDLISDKFPHDLEWEPTKRLESLQRLFAFADSHCTKAVQWYNTRKRSKQRFGYSLRFLSIIAVAVAGIIPVLSEIICRGDAAQCISPAWATVSFALAALFIALDRFSGYTSGWVRYVKSAQKLTELQGQFRLDWCMYLHGEADVSIDKSRDSENDQNPVFLNRNHGLRLCKEYISSVNSVVSRETDLWAQEFQQTLVQFEKSASQDLTSFKSSQTNSNESGASS